MVNHYLIYNRDGAFATVVINLTDADKFGEEMHLFQCGEDFSDRSQLTLKDFANHMEKKGYECQVVLHEDDYRWWLQG